MDSLRAKKILKDKRKQVSLSKSKTWQSIIGGLIIKM